MSATSLSISSKAQLPVDDLHQLVYLFASLVKKRREIFAFDSAALFYDAGKRTEEMICIRCFPTPAQFPLFAMCTNALRHTIKDLPGIRIVFCSLCGRGRYII